MARFSDLPLELQTTIWTLVLPHRGGVQWIEFEGFPQPSHIINTSLKWTQDCFDDQEPDIDTIVGVRARNAEYRKYFVGLGSGSHFFKYLYVVVPSVYGKSKKPGIGRVGKRSSIEGWPTQLSNCLIKLIQPLITFFSAIITSGSQKDVLTQDVLDEIAETRRCRQLSTYTQVATLLSTCQTSRLTALEYLHKMSLVDGYQLFRSAGPMYKPRPLDTWKQQYQYIETVPEGVDQLLPTFAGSLDLVVFRLHTASGYPTETLQHACFQMRPCWNDNIDILPRFSRIGIEWHPLWATQEGRKEICEDKISSVVMFATNLTQLNTQLYWLVDGIPRPQWDQYPPAIPAAFSRIIELRKDYVLKFWVGLDVTTKNRLLEHHDLYQEFEANGRRYYVVFVLGDWTSEHSLEDSFRDPAVSWDGPFPGGENLWPEALRDPVRVASGIQRNWAGSPSLGTDHFCNYVLSWEPM